MIYCPHDIVVIDSDGIHRCRLCGKEFQQVE